MEQAQPIEQTQESDGVVDIKTALDNSAPVPERSPAEDWRESLPDDIRTWDEAQNADNSDKFWDQLRNQRSLIGQSLRVPGPDATPEAWEQFYAKLSSKTDRVMPKPDPTDEGQMAALYKALGRPDEASGYELSEELPGVDPERLGFLKNAAHKAGLTNKQFSDALTEIARADAEQMQQYHEHVQAGVKELRGEWATAFDERVEAGKTVAEKLGAPPELIEALSQGTANAQTQRFLWNVAKAIGTEPANLPTREGVQGGIDRGEALSQAQEILEKMITIPPGDPQYEHLMAKRLKLMEIAGGGD